MSESSVPKTTRKKAAPKSEIKNNEAEASSDIVVEAPSASESEVHTEETKKESEAVPVPAPVESVESAIPTEKSVESAPKKIARPFSKDKEQTEERNTIVASS